MLHSLGNVVVPPEDGRDCPQQVSRPNLQAVWHKSRKSLGERALQCSSSRCCSNPQHRSKLWCRLATSNLIIRLNPSAFVAIRSDYLTEINAQKRKLMKFSTKFQMREGSNFIRWSTWSTRVIYIQCIIYICRNIRTCRLIYFIYATLHNNTMHKR